jgi:competence protein ComEA
MAALLMAMGAAFHARSARGPLPTLIGGPTDQSPMAKPLFQANINAADDGELQLIPNIGPTTARHIREFRERMGRIDTLEQMDAIPGLGPKRLEELQPSVIFGPEGKP